MPVFRDKVDDVRLKHIYAGIDDKIVFRFFYDLAEIGPVGL